MTKERFKYQGSWSIGNPENIEDLKMNPGRVESLVGDIQSGCPLTNDIMLRSANLDIVKILKYLENQRVIKAAEEPYREPTMMPYKPLKGTCCIRDEHMVDDWERYFGFDRRMWSRSGNSAFRPEIHVSWSTDGQWKFGDESNDVQRFEMYERVLGLK